MVYSLKPSKAFSKESGFTIVELLIVIVVIAILAAIVIVSYRGVTTRAIAASLSSDLASSAQSLKLFQVDNSAYPTTIDCSSSPAIGSLCLKAGAGTSYQYTVVNTTSPQSFCVTATKNATSYFITQDSAPMSGACAGDSTAGQVTIVNLATNPSCESNVTNWTTNGGTGGGAATISQGSNGLYGSYTCMQTTTTASTGAAGGPNIAAAGASNVSANTNYTFSGYVRINKVQHVAISVRWLTSTGTAIGTDLTNTATIDTVGNVWQRTSYTLTAPANATQARYYFYVVAGGTNWNVGDTFEVDGVMVTQGSGLYNYGDGNSSGWSWIGTPSNNTTSTGPSQLSN